MHSAVLRAQLHTPRGGPDYLPLLREEILNVIRKYVPIDQDAVKIQLDREGDCEVLELNVTAARFRAVKKQKRVAPSPG